MKQAEIPFSLTNHLLVHNNIINLASENEVVEKLSNKLNQHWVPQYHLKLFSNGNRYIHLALRDGSCMAFKISIKGQCARHRFYGNEKVEEWLSTLLIVREDGSGDEMQVLIMFIGDKSFIYILL